MGKTDISELDSEKCQLLNGWFNRATGIRKKFKVEKLF